MAKISRKNRESLDKFDRTGRYTLEEAVDILKQFPALGFDQTVDLSARLGVDPRHADQIVRGTVVLPHGTGRTMRVVVFANEGPAADAAKEAGADEVGAQDLVDKVQGGWTDFDVAIATPDMMALVGRLGRALGPRGLMPNPKSGTVTPEPAQAVDDAKGGKIEFRVDRGGNIHAPVGKIGFDRDALIDNARTVVDAIVSARPTTAKGQYVKSMTLSGTMTPGVRLDRTV
jgi:large subunit ribosomal protein L1